MQQEVIQMSRKLVDVMYMYRKINCQNLDDLNVLSGDASTYSK